MTVSESREIRGALTVLMSNLYIIKITKKFDNGFCGSMYAALQRILKVLDDHDELQI